MAILFAGGEPVAVRASGGVEPSGTGWGDAEAAGVRTEVLEPLRAWRVAFADEDGAHGFSLELTARSGPAMLDAGDPAARLGGMEGYEQLVEARGEVTIAGRSRRLRGAGQRGHSWGAPDWERLSLSRSMGAWLEDGTGVTLLALRPGKAQSHADEALHAVLLEREPDSEGDGDGMAEPTVVADPRLSTTYDSNGRQRHAGLELYVREDDDFARRAAGEVVCGTTLDLGTLRLDCAFFRWRMEGRTGVGRYDVLRRTDV
jgi:hypothetical protein